MTEPKSKASVKKAAILGTTAKKAAPKTSTIKTAKIVSNQEFFEMIQYAAYFIAEHNGFVGNSQDFWAEAEVQISKKKP